MKRTYLDYVLDILSSIDEVIEFVEGLDFGGFVKDRKTVNAVIRSLEVMGEAVKKIPVEVRDRYPNIPWKHIAGMRDKLIHEYHGVDLEIVWKVIKEEIPPLKPAFERVLRDLRKGE